MLDAALEQEQRPDHPAGLPEYRRQRQRLAVPVHRRWHHPPLEDGDDLLSAAWIPVQEAGDVLTRLEREEIVQVALDERSDQQSLGRDWVGGLQHQPRPDERRFRRPSPEASHTAGLLR